MYLGIAAAIFVFSVSYVINHNPNARENIVAMNVQGIEIIPGKTTAKELLEGGFQLAEQQVSYIIDPEIKAEANSCYAIILPVKEKKSYGTITIENDSNTAQAVPQVQSFKNHDI